MQLLTNGKCTLRDASFKQFARKKLSSIPEVQCLKYIAGHRHLILLLHHCHSASERKNDGTMAFIPPIGYVRDIVLDNYNVKIV